MDVDVDQGSTPEEPSKQPGVEAIPTTDADATGPQSFHRTYIQCGNQDAIPEVNQHPSPSDISSREMHSKQHISEQPLQRKQMEIGLSTLDAAQSSEILDKVVEPSYAERTHESFEGDYAGTSASSHVANSGYVTDNIFTESGRNGEDTLNVCEKEYQPLSSTITLHCQPHETCGLIHKNGLENLNLKSKPCRENEESFPSDLPLQEEVRKDKSDFVESKLSEDLISSQMNSVRVDNMGQRKQSKAAKLDVKRWTSPRSIQNKFKGSYSITSKKGKHNVQDMTMQKKQAPPNHDLSESDNECLEQTLRSFRDRLLRRKQVEFLERRKTGESTGLRKRGDNTAENNELPAQCYDFSAIETPRQLPEASLAKTVKTPKELVRDIVKDALLEAGFKIELRPRQSRDYNDSVYVSPAGHSYWSLPKAWEALKKESNEAVDDSDRNLSLNGNFNEVNGCEQGISDGGQINTFSLADKSTLEQVLLWFGKDKRLISAFKKLGSFSGAGIHDIVGQVEVTNAKLADILLVDLGLLRRLTSKSRERQSCLSPPLIDESRGRKRKRETGDTIMNVAIAPMNNKVPSRMKCMQTMKTEKSKMQLKQVKKVLQAMPQVSESANLSLLEVVRKRCRKEKVNKKSISKINKANLTKQSVSSKKGKKAKSRAGFRLEFRPANLNIDAASESLCNRKLTVFSWMIDREAVMEKEKIFCLDNFKNQTLKEGVVTRDGILCRCCKKFYTIHAFKSHGRSHRKPAHDLAFSSGRSILDCQLEAWTAEQDLRRTHNYVGVSVDDTNDDTCLLCGDGGDLICCDQCPSTFHMSCLGIDNLPEGNWYCPKCRCGICGRNDQNKRNKASMIQCSQCERHYHVSCLQVGRIVDGKYSFCSRACRKIFSRLRQLVGVVHPLTRGLTWSLLRCMDEDREVDSINIKTRMEHHNKLAVALLVVKECFNPMIDPRTNVDMITQALYNRWSEFDRLNYSGFYTAILEREGEIISAATIRVHGAQIAEMPLIGTRQQHRRQGMCRLLVGAIEELLRTLEVATFILPAIPDLFNTWTHAFGFQPLHVSQRLEIRDLSMMIFPGTELLQKNLLETPEDAIVLKKESDSAPMPDKYDNNNDDDEGKLDASQRSENRSLSIAVYTAAMDFNPENSMISSSEDAEKEVRIKMDTCINPVMIQQN